MAESYIVFVISSRVLEFQRQWRWGHLNVAIEQRSLVDLAVSEIQRLIHTGVYKPGEKLGENELSLQLGVSRPPLREALRELAQRGIIERAPRRGSRVVSLTAKEVKEIYSLREALENFAATAAFPNPNPQSLKMMRGALDDMAVAASKSDHGEIVRSNRDFHVALVGMANHSLLVDIYVGLMDKMQLCMSDNLRMETEVAGDYESGVNRHRLLLESIESGNVKQVLNALRDHGERQVIGTFYESEPSS